MYVQKEKSSSAGTTPNWSEVLINMTGNHSQHRFPKMAARTMYNKYHTDINVNLIQELEKEVLHTLKRATRRSQHQCG